VGALARTVNAELAGAAAVPARPLSNAAARPWSRAGAPSCPAHSPGRRHRSARCRRPDTARCHVTPGSAFVSAVLRPFADDAGQAPAVLDQFPAMAYSLQYGDSDAPMTLRTTTW